ncbi:UNKNOWN [Stylonychia lemnae]|uniref:Transmembrane protein n=1 Tax=Stylonychia lemnae TaxID=5949 RepID=A0A077ZXR6_STYLE|nr:UNKNOWN [Stylonychia lemnae]|eukprot:CDW74367.1 UNKNOWN [Stylonychia lemnae]
MCCSEDSINATSSGMALVCLILNIFIPGAGTVVNAVSGHKVCPGVLYGVLQFIFTMFFFGWIWSIVYGIKIVQVAEKHGHHDGYKSNHHDDHHHDHHGHH